MLVSSIMDTTPACCVPFDTADAVASVMKRNDIEFMPVIENEPTHMFVGVITDRDLCLRVLADRKNPEHTQIGDVMTVPGVSCRRDDDLEKAVRLMRRRGVHHLPVLDDQDCVVGVISMTDALLKLNREPRANGAAGRAKVRRRSNAVARKRTRRPVTSECPLEQAQLA